MTVLGRVYFWELPCESCAGEQSAHDTLVIAEAEACQYTQSLS